MARSFSVLLALVWATSAGAAARVKVIGIPSCPIVAGPPPYSEWIRPSSWGGVETNWSSTTATVLFCDGQLPAGATGFDYAELQYLWNSNDGDVLGPSAAAYLDMRVAATDGTSYPVTAETGECAASENFQVTWGAGVCRLAGGVSFVDGSGNPTSAYPVSLHFLIFLPVTNDYSDNEAIRLFVHYQGP
jgi:hypothetical protein